MSSEKVIGYTVTSEAIDMLPTDSKKLWIRWACNNMTVHPFELP